MDFTVNFKPYIICTYQNSEINKEITSYKYLDVFDYQTFILNHNIKLNGLICDILYPFKLFYNPITFYPDIEIQCIIKVSEDDLKDLTDAEEIKDIRQEFNDYMIETYGLFDKNKEVDIGNKAVDTWMCGDILMFEEEPNKIEKFSYEFGLCFMSID